jgi:ABC-type sugar transport system ATPase subunit
MLYVTHDQTEAMTMASRIGILDHGRLVQVGTPREIYERPDQFVRRGSAGFAGDQSAADRSAAGNRCAKGSSKRRCADRARRADSGRRRPGRKSSWWSIWAVRISSIWR